MSDFKSDYACDSCRHAKVCKYAEEYIYAMESLLNAKIHHNGENGETLIKRIQDLSFTKPIELKCVFYEKKDEALIK